MNRSGGSAQRGIRLGGGSAFFNDRLDAALELVQGGSLDVLILETLAERTIAMLHAAKRDGGHGYWAAMKGRLEVLLPALVQKQTRLVTNFGGADPIAAARMAAGVAAGAGLKLKVAAVDGDDVGRLVQDLDPVIEETGRPLSQLGYDVVSANAYLGAGSIADAYAEGSDVIVTGRVTDSALALGPAMAHFSWDRADMSAMACGVLAGHLLECGGQATGGYFAEPGMKDVPGLDRLGFPIAEIGNDRSITVTKPHGSGGRIDRHTITEQLLYEMHDPSAYLTPDVTLDITALGLEESAADVVRLTGAGGRTPPDRLKVLIGVESGFLTEVEMSYGGMSAERRARLAADLLKQRFSRIAAMAEIEVRYDLIGIDSLWPSQANRDTAKDVRLRVAARLPARVAADRFVTEVESLYVNGPAGGGGARIHLRPTIRTFTTYVPRNMVKQRWLFVDAEGETCR